jgi:hypothetical protein
MDIEDQEESSKRELQLQRFKLCNCELLVFMMDILLHWWTYTNHDFKIEIEIIEIIFVIIFCN